MNKEKKEKIKKQSTNEWTKLKNRKKLMPEPPKEASSNLRQIEIPYARAYRPRLTKRTGRVIQFATRVTAEFDTWILRFPVLLTLIWFLVIPSFELIHKI